MTQDAPKVFDPTKPVRTRDGRAARILCTDLRQVDGRTIVVVKTRADGNEVVYTMRADGRYNDLFDKDSDLVNIPAPRALLSRGADTFAGNSELQALIANEALREAVVALERNGFDAVKILRALMTDAPEGK